MLGTDIKAAANTAHGQKFIVVLHYKLAKIHEFTYLYQHSWVTK